MSVIEINEVSQAEAMIMDEAASVAIVAAAEIVGYRSGPIDAETGVRTPFSPEVIDGTVVLRDLSQLSAAHYCLQEAMRGSERLINAYQRSLDQASRQSVFAFPVAHRERLAAAIAGEADKNAIRYDIASTLIARLVLINCDNTARYLAHEDTQLLQSVRSRTANVIA